VPPVLGAQDGRHGLDLSVEELEHEERFDHVVGVMPQSDLAASQVDTRISRCYIGAKFRSRVSNLFEDGR